MPISASAEDKRIIKKALQKEMSVVEHTRFLQLISPGEGDVTRELMQKRKQRGVEEAYQLFLKRIKQNE